MFSTLIGLFFTFICIYWCLLQSQVTCIPSQEQSISAGGSVQLPTHLSSRYTVSEEHQKAKQQFFEKERENARMEAKRRKLMEKRVRSYHIVHFHSLIYKGFLATMANWCFWFKEALLENCHLIYLFYLENEKHSIFFVFNLQYYSNTWMSILRASTPVSL